VSERFCVMDGCDRALAPPTAHGLCSPHYQRWLRHGDPLYVRPLIVGVAACSIEGCEKIVQARGWCSAREEIA
jgi:hypothetical protein